MKSSVLPSLCIAVLVIGGVMITTCSLAFARPLHVADTTIAASDSTKYPKVDVMAEFPGGMEALAQFLGKNVKYPSEARRKGHQGTVFVAFIVEVDGSVKQPFIVKGISPELDRESLRVVNLFPKWMPAVLNDTTVASRFVLPMKFKLSGTPKLRRSDWH